MYTVDRQSCHGRKPPGSPQRGLPGGFLLKLLKYPVFPVNFKKGGQVDVMGASWELNTTENKNMMGASYNYF